MGGKITYPDMKKKISYILGRQTEDRTYSLKLDGKSGPKIVEEKPTFNKPKK